MGIHSGEPSISPICLVLASSVLGHLLCSDRTSTVRSAASASDGRHTPALIWTKAEREGCQLGGTQKEYHHLGKAERGIGQGEKGTRMLPSRNGGWKRTQSMPGGGKWINKATGRGETRRSREKEKQVCIRICIRSLDLSTHTPPLAIPRGVLTTCQRYRKRQRPASEWGGGRGDDGPESRWASGEG